MRPRAKFRGNTTLSSWEAIFAPESPKLETIRSLNSLIRYLTVMGISEAGN